MNQIPLTPTEFLSLLESVTGPVPDEYSPEPEAKTADPCICNLRAYIAGIRATADHILDVIGE